MSWNTLPEIVRRRQVLLYRELRPAPTDGDDGAYLRQGPLHTPATQYSAVHGSGCVQSRRDIRGSFVGKLLDLMYILRPATFELFERQVTETGS